jgi:hypothetical protein
MGLLPDSFIETPPISDLWRDGNAAVPKHDRHYCCGSAVRALLVKLSPSATPMDRLREIVLFFEFPHGASDVVLCAKSLLNGELPPNDDDIGSTILPVEILARATEKRAEAAVKHIQTQVSSTVGHTYRTQNLVEAAELYLKIGKIQQYCELLFDAGLEDRALAAAPLVSIDFWQALARRAAERSREIGDLRALEYFVIAGESHKAADFVSSFSNFTDAMLIVRSCPQALEGRRSVNVASLPPQVDAAASQSKINEYAMRNARRLLNAGNPCLAAAAILAVREIPQAVELLIRCGEPCVAHLLFHTLPVPATLIDDGYVAYIVRAIPYREWVTVKTCIERHSTPVIAASLAWIVASETLGTDFSQFEDVQRLTASYAQSGITLGAQNPSLREIANNVWAAQRNASKRSDHVRAILQLVWAAVERAATELEKVHGTSKQAPLSTMTSQDRRFAIEGAKATLQEARQACNLLTMVIDAPEGAPPARRALNEDDQLILSLGFAVGFLLSSFVYRFDSLSDALANASRTSIGRMELCRQGSPSTNADAMRRLLQRILDIGRPPPLEATSPSKKSGKHFRAVYRCAPCGGKLPVLSVGGRPIRSSLSGQWIQGGAHDIAQCSSGRSPQPLSPLYASTQEVNEWFLCCWYSPHGDGGRILPPL